MGHFYSYGSDYRYVMENDDSPVAIPCRSWIGAVESSTAKSVPSRRRRTQFGVSPTVLFSEDGVMENKSLEGIPQHYNSASDCTCQRSARPQLTCCRMNLRTNLCSAGKTRFNLKLMLHWTSENDANSSQRLAGIDLNSLPTYRPVSSGPTPVTGQFGDI